MSACGTEATSTTDAGARAAPAAEPVTAVPGPEAIYVGWRDRFQDDPALVRSEAWPTMRADLKRVANEADDVHLRANAGLLLGAGYDARSEPERAAEFYRHASKLVPDDAGPAMALALALAKQNAFAEAAEVQARAAALDPDNLENWLVLGELRLKAGDEAGSAAAYVDYERRRKGLIDGLTLQRDGAYMISKDERIGCAEALASATDEGTAVALAYALKTDPEASVRATVARVMGIERVLWFREVLEPQLATEADPDVREAIVWALSEIARDPVDVVDDEGPRGPSPVPATSTRRVPG